MQNTVHGTTFPVCMTHAKSRPTQLVFLYRLVEGAGKQQGGGGLPRAGGGGGGSSFFVAKTIDFESSVKVKFLKD